MVDVLLVDDDDDDVAADEVRAVLHELALEAMARRAMWARDLGPLRPDAEVGVDVVVAGPVPTGLARRLVARYRRRAVAVGVLVVLVAATTAVVDARRTAARVAAFEAMPAVLAQTSGPLAEVWRIPGRVVGDGDDTLLVVDDAALRSVDPATGTTTWTASAAAARAAGTGDCFAVDESLRPDRAPVEAGTGPGGLVACVAGASPDGTGSVGGSVGEATTGVDVVVVDSTTGRTRQAVAADGALLLAEPVGRDLLLATALPDATVRVTRWDLATGTPRWDVRSPQPVHPAGGTPAGGAPAVERRPDTLTVGTFAVDLATGEAVDAQRVSTQPYPYEQHVLPGGARAIWAWHREGTSGRGAVTGGTAGARFSLPGPPLAPAVTDGSGDSVLVVRTAGRDRLRGVDLRSGRTRWSLPYPGAPTAVATGVVDGALLLDDGATVTALRVGTGETVWRAPVDPEATGDAAVTDGDVVVLPVRADDGILHLAGYRVADGRVLWRTPAPAGTVSVAVVDHGLVAVTGHEVIGLR